MIMGEMIKEDPSDAILVIRLVVVRLGTRVPTTNCS